MDLLYLSRKMPVVVVGLLMLLAEKPTYAQITPGIQEGIRLNNADIPKQISLLDNNIGLKEAIQESRGNVIGDLQYININDSRRSVNDIIINHGRVNGVENGRNIGGLVLGTAADFSGGGMQQAEITGQIGIPLDVSGKTDIQNKLQLEITELKGMQSRILHDASTSGNSANMQTLLNHIGTQIQLREAQQDYSNNVRHQSTRSATDQLASLESPFSERALIQPGYKTQILHAGDNGNAHPQVLYNSNPESVLPKHYVPHSIMQSPVMLKDQTIIAQEQNKQGVFPQSSIQHILVPINSLSFDQILMSDLKSHVRSQQSHGAIGEHIPGKTNVVQPEPDQHPTTIAPITTRKPKTTRRPSSPTTPRTPQPTTTVNMDKLEREYLHSSLQKQQLEISKLTLEIRALQRQETVNMPEMENEDAPPQRRGRFPNGMMPFPPFPFPR